jgi:hypothetical protein
LAQRQVTGYKHIEGPGLPYMVPATQPRLMKRVASFLLASRPLWSPPPPTRSRPPHSHLYASPKRFHVESHLLLGCSHKIPNRASVTLELSCHGVTASNMVLSLPRRSTVAFNTTLGPERHGYPWVPTDQGLSRLRQAGPTYQKTRRPVSGPSPT